jgi:hypothetical protein
LIFVVWIRRELRGNLAERVRVSTRGDLSVIISKWVVLSALRVIKDF